MIKLGMLASSARPLADVFLGSLRASGRWSRLRAILPEEQDFDPEPHQFSLELEDENNEKSERPSPEIVHPDEAAAAILLGKAFEPLRDVLARLRQPDMLAIVEVAHPDLVDPVSRMLRKHVLGPGAPVLDGDDLRKRTTVASPGTVVIYESTDEATSRRKTGGFEFAAAVQLRCAIIGVASDPSLLPPELVSMAEHCIVVPPLDGDAITAVIEAVTGRRPSTQLDENLASRVTLELLSIAVRADFGAEGSSARLRRLLDAQDQDEEGPLLSEIHGLGPAKQWGLELAADLRDYRAGRLPWSACPKGLLISGPPGTFKTSYARALAREVAGVGFISTSCSAWLSHKEGHLGNVTAAIRKTFSDARAKANANVAHANRGCCIVFCDEIDSLPARGRAGRDDPWFSAVVNCLLECLDGYDKREGIIFIAACNDPSKLDSALVRAGRLDHHVAIPLPDVPALIGIFRMHLGSDLERADLRAAALAARGRTGADVERWVRMARRCARDAGRPLKLQDLNDAVRGGEREWPADVRRRIAYHEAGHAIALLALGIAEPKALSIGGAGGLAESELSEMQAETRAELEKVLVALLGGRAAEQITFGGEVTAGAGGSLGSDLDRATRLAIRLETAFGFGSLGLVCLPDGLSPHDLLTFDRLRDAVASTLNGAYTSALDILGRNRGALDALATALFDAGYLDQAEIGAVLLQTPLRPQAAMRAPASRHPQGPEAAPVQNNVEDADRPPFTFSEIVTP